KPSEGGDAYQELRANTLKSFLGSPRDEETNQPGRSHADIVAILEILEPEQVIEIEAFLAADLFEVTSLKNTDVQAVIAMIDPDMTAEGFKADAEFMGKLNRAQLLQIILEIDPTDKTPGSTKKGDLVAKAAGLAGASHWLPPQLR